MAKRDFGGAFDIDPADYWTKDDILEFMDALQEDKEVTTFNITIKEANVDRDDTLYVTFEFDWGEYTVSNKIDLRKAKTKDELIKKYVPVFVEAILEVVKDNA